MHASVEPPRPETRALFEALQHDGIEKERFLGTVAGTVPISEFYAPENVQRIIRSAHLPKTLSA
jgi:hypothetical protein